VQRMYDDNEISRIYQVLSNPSRQKIIEFLGSKGKASITEIKRALKMSTGSLYYNIDLLGDLIERDPKKKFSLSDKGWIAYNLLKNGKESILDAKYYRNHFIPLKLRSKLSLIFHPRWLFLTLYDYKSLQIAIPIIVLLLGASICYSTNVELTLFAYSYKPTQPPIYSALKFILSWIIIYIMAETLPFILHGRIGGHISLLSGLAIATLPLLPIPFLVSLSSTNLYLLLSAVVFLLQFISCLLFSASIGASKNIGTERALLIGFLIVYFNITLLILARS